MTSCKNAPKARLNGTQIYNTQFYSKIILIKFQNVSQHQFSPKLSYHRIAIRPFNCRFPIFLFIKYQIFICLNGLVCRNVCYIHCYTYALSFPAKLALLVYYESSKKSLIWNFKSYGSPMANC